MGKKENRSLQKEVFTEKDLKEAMKQEYGTIIVQGEIAQKVLKNVDRHPKLQKLSNWSLIGGIFLWPLLLAGIAGKMLTIADFKNYEVTDVTSDELTLERK